jgi:hypothetical protein
MLVMAVGFCAIAMFNSLELFITIFMIFRRRTSLYFYSLITATSGVFIFALFLLIMLLDVVQKNYIIVVFVNFGWSCMVTGQSLVLFSSRLHLIVYNMQNLRWVLAMIIVNCIVFTPATLVAGIKVWLSLRVL